jgi:NitT/TauT family transport system substrate-binding protein
LGTTLPTSPRLHGAGGSVQVVTGAYGTQGQDILAVIELGHYPGIALAVKKDRAHKIKTVADLKAPRSA